MQKNYIYYGKPRVSLSESTKQLLDEEQIIITNEDTQEEIVKKVSKSKKVITKIKEDGSVVIKQSLNG